jgi:hypothetical protein
MPPGSRGPISCAASSQRVPMSMAVRNRARAGLGLAGLGRTWALVPLGLPSCAAPHIRYSLNCKAAKQLWLRRQHRRSLARRTLSRIASLREFVSSKSTPFRFSSSSSFGRRRNEVRESARPAWPSERRVHVGCTTHAQASSSSPPSAAQLPVRPIGGQPGPGECPLCWAPSLEYS